MVVPISEVTPGIYFREAGVGKRLIGVAGRQTVDVPLTLEPVIIGRMFRSYFYAEPVDLDQVRDGLWNPAVDTDAYADGRDKYQAAVFEQYKIYVEMADRISARRALTNTFFLSLNTAVLTAAGAFVAWSGHRSWLLALPVAVLVVQAGAWFWLIRSYRQLNTAKYAVVGVLEERLPASPYWRAEWTALGEGRDKARYWPLTHLEQWLPLIFIALYIVGFVVAVATRR